MSPTINEYNEPWTHWVVDDFLDKATYDYLVAERDSFPYKLIDTHNTHKKTYAKFGYFLESDLLLESINEAITRTIGKHELTVVSEIVRCEPKYAYPVHSDHPAKLYTIVTYLHPEKSDGTVLLSATDKTKIEVEWKPNRALIFKQNPNSPHYYLNSTSEYRYTLNVFLTEKNIRFRTKNA